MAGELHPVHAEQERHKCCCRRISARECYRVRYGLDLRDMIDGTDSTWEDDDECSCVCHDADRDDYDLEDP